jgi:large subunit ribosomal protein L15
MVENKRKKNSRQRGSKTHGWGSMKKHRGAGHRGGRGAAGSGKRGDAKKPSIWKAYPNIGKRGFTSKSSDHVSVITISYLERFTKTLSEEGYLKADGKATTILLDQAGYDKLLGNGTPTKAWHITVKHATEGAIAKIKKAGGSVTLLDAQTDEAPEDTAE